jgi:hypothetical protein
MKRDRLLFMFLIAVALLLVGCPKRIRRNYLPVVEETAAPEAGIPKHCVTAMSNDPNHPLKDLGNGWWYGPVYVRGDCIHYFQQTK